METLIKGLGAYDLFVNLIPGVLWYLFSPDWFQQPFNSANGLELLIICYFFGIVLSRVGSLVIENFLKWRSWIFISDYTSFIKAEEMDEKVSKLERIGNLYRSLASMAIILCLIYTVNNLCGDSPAGWYKPIVFLALAILFIFSFMKQKRYVAERVQVDCNYQTGNEDK